MIEYILYTCIGTYYCSFCAMAAYVCYKERQEENNARRREYRELIQQTPSINITSSDRININEHSLYPIMEELEESI